MTDQETIAALRVELLREQEMNHGLDRALKAAKVGNGATAEAVAIESETVIRYENSLLRADLRGAHDQIHGQSEVITALRGELAKTKLELKAWRRDAYRQIIAQSDDSLLKTVLNKLIDRGEPFNFEQVTRVPAGMPEPI